MTIWRKGLTPAAVLAAVALVLPLSATTASAQTQTVNEDEIPFGSTHPCTHEPVQGDSTVHMTIITQSNPDGTTTVKVRQHTHGQQLLGDISLDWYTFNDNEDSDTEFTFFGPSGSSDVWTRFIHTSEDIAFQEEPGLDDYFQKTTLFISPLLPPVLVEDERPDCR